MIKDGSIEILLVTTRESKRWIIPKGGPVKGLKPPKSAAREAFEEAGIRGAVRGKAIGSLKFDKTPSENGVFVHAKFSFTRFWSSGSTKLGQNSMNVAHAGSTQNEP